MSSWLASLVTPPAAPQPVPNRCTPVKVQPGLLLAQLLLMPLPVALLRLALRLQPLLCLLLPLQCLPFLSVQLLQPPPGLSLAGQGARFGLVTACCAALFFSFQECRATASHWHTGSASLPVQLGPPLCLQAQPPPGPAMPAAAPPPRAPAAHAPHECGPSRAGQPWLSPAAPPPAGHGLHVRDLAMASPTLCCIACSVTCCHL